MNKTPFLLFLSLLVTASCQGAGLVNGTLSPTPSSGGGSGGIPTNNGNGTNTTLWGDTEFKSTDGTFSIGISGERITLGGASIDEELGSGILRLNGDSGLTINGGVLYGNGSGLTNISGASGSVTLLTNVTIWTSNSGPAISFNYPTNASAQTLEYMPTTNNAPSWHRYSVPNYFFGKNDQIMSYGYNHDAGGGLIDPTKLGVMEQFEPYYFTGTSFYQVEWWVGLLYPVNSGTTIPGGGQRRPFFATGATNGFQTAMVEADEFIVYGDASRTTKVIDVLNTNALTFASANPMFDFMGTAGLTLQNRNAGGSVFEYMIPNANTGTTTNYNNYIVSCAATNVLGVGRNPPGAVGVNCASNFVVQTSGGNGPVLSFGGIGGAGTVNGLTVSSGGIATTTGGNITDGGSLQVQSGITNVSGLSMFTGGLINNGVFKLGVHNRVSTTPNVMWTEESVTTSSGRGGPLFFNVNPPSGNGVGWGWTTDATDFRWAFGFVGAINWSAFPTPSIPTLDIMGTNIVWTSQIVSNNLTVVSGQYNGNGAGLTNLPPSSITGRSYVQTNFVLNTVYAAPNGPLTTVAGTAIITAAAAVGNVELDVMYQAGGSGAYTAISAPSLTTTVLSIVMPYQIPFSATITNGNFYLTNATTTAGGNASLKSGTGTMTTF